MLGVRLEVAGAPAPRAVLIVANHVSWLDILVINTVCPATFVSKHEIAAWPAVGVLLARTGTILLRRGNARAAKRAVIDIGATLATGRRVAVFPEGTTTDGSSLLPFRPALLQAAIDHRRPVLPIALSYHDADGRRSAVPAFVGDVTLWCSLRAIARAPQSIAKVRVLPAQAGRGIRRRELAAQARTLISEELGRQYQPAAEPEHPRRGIAGGLGLPRGLGAAEEVLQVTEPG